MPVYLIERLEVHVRTYRVEAADEAEAVLKLFDGEGELVGADPAAAEVCDDRGLPAADHPALAAALRRAGFMSDQTVIPSVRSIERLPDGTPVCDQPEDD